MKIIRTHETLPSTYSPMEREWVYNGIDACITGEILDVLLPQLDDHTTATYDFSRSLQGPVLEMRLRGVRVDAGRKSRVVDEYFELLDRLERQLDRIVLDGVGLINFNWRSNDDKRRLFYGALGIPVIRRQGRPTVDINALEKMQTDYLIARQICAHLLMMGELQKKIQVLKTEVDPDGRIRTSYNIAGTNTGRFSSSFSEFGTGGNLQNVEESLRSIFVADPGMKLAKFDAKSGESYVVGAIEWNLFADGRYLEACESGDPHTATARICWPNLPWTGDLKQDKEIAERKYYRHYSYRFMCKKIGHGSNYGGKPQTLSTQAKLPIAIISEFQPKYFKAYPAHLRWHDHVDTRLRKDGYLVSLTGRKRWFFGRRSDDSTFREAVAYDPQGSLADIVNRAMLKVWSKRDATLYMHDHDAITIQYPEEREDEIIPKIIEQLKVPISLEGGRTLEIPFDCVVGWNRGKYDSDNPDGLRDYIPGDGKRQRTPEVPILHRKW
jgi:DNA polymerase-1